MSIMSQNGTLQTVFVAVKYFNQVNCGLTFFYWTQCPQNGFKRLYV